jgi:TetR/AcrR family fatty acid metabolism transcriptional regulator
MEDKRQRILESAITVFAREGLDKGKIADIAKAAGIGKGTIYEYFRSKHDIFMAIEEYFLSNLNNTIEQIVHADYPPPKKLEVFIRQGFDSLVGMGDALLIITELWAQASRGHWHGEHDSAMVNMYHDYREKIMGILDSGMISSDFREMNKVGVATMIMAFMDGLAWQYVMLRNPELFQHVKDEAIRSLLRGLKK